ncbi:uncharacterized protein RBU33_024860 isoform 2-T3 [Hipposideros larvatus]
MSKPSRTDDIILSEMRSPELRLLNLSFSKGAARPTTEESIPEYFRSEVTRIARKGRQVTCPCLPSLTVLEPQKTAASGRRDYHCFSKDHSLC